MSENALEKAPAAEAEPGADNGPAMQALIGIEALKQSARLSGFSGGGLLLLVGLVASLGSASTRLDTYWLTWAAIPAIAAAFGGPLLARLLLSRRSLSRWRLVLLAIMTANSGAWAFASAVAVGNEPVSVVLLVIAWLALSLAVLPTLSWLAGLVVQLSLQLVFTAAFAVFPGVGLTEFLLPLGLWGSLAFLALIGAFFARRVDLVKADVHFLRVEASELQQQLDDVSEQLSDARQQRVTMEQELGEILDLAEGANRAKTEFLATMSHEIRTPLNGILPILEMLQDTPLNAEQMRMVRTAQGSSRHLLRIINDILDFAKVESGKLQLESIEIQVREMVDAVTDLMSGSARNRNLKLSASVADNVPQRVRGDPIRLRQVLINLVSNAIKFTEEGGIRVEVSRGQSSKKEVELLFAVADTGIGMTPDTADRLFQSFTQADASTTRKHGGTGLGLVICKRLVELMGGRIGVRSTLGQGSTFWFLVPLRKSVTEVPSARRDLRGVRILTVIGDSEVGSQVAQDLRAWGIVVESTVDPQDAIEKLRSTSMLGETWTYELVLIDGSGIEQRLPGVLAEIRNIDTIRHVHIVVSVRSDSLAQKLKRDYGALLLTDALRPEPLRRLLYRVFDVEIPYYGNVDLRMEEVYDDLNVSIGDVALDAEENNVQPTQKFSGTVLLVEDNPVNLGVVKKALSKLGLQCESAADGREALTLFGQQSFQIIFMDCQMPVMDGYEATGEIRQEEALRGMPRTPIVAMTANAMAGDREKCIDAGMDDYLAKPVGLVELRECVARWMMPHGSALAGSPRQGGVPALAPAVPPSAPEPDVLDARVLNELKEIMDDDYLSLLRTYLRNAPTLLDEARRAVADADVEAMVRPVHSLKSSSANVGAMRLSELARETERHAREGDFDAAKRVFAAVEEAYRAADAALHSHVAGGSSLASRA